MSLDAADIERIAALAHLELTDDEKAVFTRQLASILDYIDQIQRADTADVPPTASVLAGPPAERDDDVRASLERTEALANAPEGSPYHGLFKVPRVIAG